METANQLQTAITLAKSLLAMAIFFSLIKVGILYYSKVSDDSNQEGGKSIVRWLHGITFMVIAVGIVGAIEKLLYKSMLGIDSAWAWAQSILGLVFFVVLIQAIIRVYNSQEPDNSMETTGFRKSLERFGIGLILLIISFAVVSGFKGTYEGASNVKIEDSFSLISSGQLDQWIIFSFKKAVMGSKIMESFFVATSSLVIIFFLISTITNFHKLNTGEKTDVWTYAKPIILVFLVGSWSWIYKGLDAGFDAIENLFITTLGETGDRSTMMKFITGVTSDTSVSMLIAPMVKIIEIALSYSLLFINYIIDVIVLLYIQVNLMLLVIFAPIALLLAFFSLTDSSVVTWFKQFLLFRLFSLVPVMINAIGLSFLTTLANTMTDDPQAKAILQVLSIESIITLFAFAAFIILKVIIILSAFSLMKNLINTGESGVGGAVGGMSKAALKAFAI